MRASSRRWLAEEVRHRVNVARRVRLASRPKWRMRMKPRGTTCRRKRRRNSSACERHDLHAVVVGVVLPTKPDAAVTVIDEPIIRQRDAVGVPPEIVEHLLGTGEGPLRIHDPVDGPQPTEEAGEGVAIGQIGGATREGQLARVEGALQAGEILRAKDRRQRPDGKEERRSTGDPPRAVRGQGAAGDQAVQMEVLRESLAPRVEDRGDPDRAAEVSRVAPEGEQRVGGRAKEERIDHARIALRERVEVVRQREDDVEVRNRAAGRRGAPRATALW